MWSTGKSASVSDGRGRACKALCVPVASRSRSTALDALFELLKDSGCRSFSSSESMSLSLLMSMSPSSSSSSSSSPASASESRDRRGVSRLRFFGLMDHKE